MSSSPHKVDFKAKQAEFSAYIRNPQTHPCPADVPRERMQMYRELFLNNVESFLSSNFPVLHTLLAPVQWQQLARDFFEYHPCTTPYFSEIPEEFILYLQNERPANADDYPFMLELAHYEWVEMALSISQETHSQIPPAPLQLTQNIKLSPLTWLLAYQYPVHKISPDYLPSEPPEHPSYLAVYRNVEDEVKFIELAPMSFHLLQTLQNQHQASSSVNQLLSDTLPKNTQTSLKEAATEALQHFINKQLIIPA